MDQPTRNLLQNATQRARRLLETEIAEQLGGTFDILADGTVSAKPGPHLTPDQALVRQRLVESVRHRAGDKFLGSASADGAEAVGDYTREAAFTVLNRFVALKMLEARGLVQQCISKGDQSSGFREFTLLAPALLTFPDKGFRLYLECVFDELSVEVKILFDRHDPSSLIWPRRQALDELLSILNDADLAGVWGVDETIGWVYQYFNSQADRDRARYDSSGKPKAPQSSYELAVRNQFFTPRYVVQFLTDNTLGRIWYEMRKGQTRLADQCEYMVRRAAEIFLSDGEQPPSPGTPGEGRGEGSDLSQEELLKQPVHIPHRPRKDPRDIKILDPASGSGHFLLYGFDLLLTIYEEAWNDTDSPVSQITGAMLRDDYPSQAALREAIPGLILRHNLHGVDIDPRCAQIAALALWMRAQRAFADFKLPRDSRPVIRKTNIIVAEPMPGESDLFEEFLRELKEDRLESLIRSALSIPADRQVRATRAMADSLCDLVRTVWDKMKLAGEMGSLLRIEHDLATAIAKGREEWEERLTLFRVTQYDLGDSARTSYARMIPGEEADFWTRAETMVLKALESFGHRAEADGARAFRRGLFAEDAARGLALFDLVRNKYDSILMNPPFGEVSIGSREYLYKHIPETSRDLFAGFVSRFCERLADGGRLGAITNRTALFSDFLGDWRRRNFAGGITSLATLIDLGYGVLDAVVETAAYVCERRPPSQMAFLQVLKDTDKCNALRGVLRDIRGSAATQSAFVRNPVEFLHVPDARFIYNLHPTWIAMLAADAEHPLLVSRAGLTSGDDLRFLRCFWEVNEERIGSRWKWLAKGGEFGRYRTDIHLLIDWQAREFLSRTRNSELYGRAGITYTERTTSNLSARILNRESCFSGPGPGVIPRDEHAAHFLLAFMNSFVVSYCMEAIIGGGDFSVKGSAARHLEPGYVNHLPSCTPSHQDLDWFREMVERLVRLLDRLDDDEAHPLFYGVTLRHVGSLPQAIATCTRNRFQYLADCYRIVVSLELRMSELLGVTPARIPDVFSDTGWPLPMGKHLDVDAARMFISLDPISANNPPSVQSVVRYRFENKLSHYLHDGIERAARQLAVSADVLCEWLSQNAEPSEVSIERHAIDMLSFGFGVAVGRWGRTDHEDERDGADRADVFAALPSRPPARHGARSASALLVDDIGSPDDILLLVGNALGHVFLEGELIWVQLSSLLIGSASVSPEVAIREWFRNKFFSDHLARYSKSRRNAPIYWPLATPSASYTVWLYAHRVSGDTLFRVQDLGEEKLEHEQRNLSNLKQAAGANPTASQRKELETAEGFVAELATMLDEVKRVAPLWKPDLDDGIVLVLAPLWRLFPQHRAWQGELKTRWGSLCAGEYDWAHVAMHLWPERVVPKCQTDRSLAIAHGLEKTFWEDTQPDAEVKPQAEATSEGEAGEDGDMYGDEEEPTPKKRTKRAGGKQRWVPRPVDKQRIAQLIAERTHPGVQAALKSLLEAPTPGGKMKRKK